MINLKLGASSFVAERLVYFYLLRTSADEVCWCFHRSGARGDFQTTNHVYRLDGIRC